MTGADVWGRTEAQDVDDVEWIPWAARNGCVGLTADEKVRYKCIERMALVENRLQVFCFLHDNLLIGEQVRRVMSQIERMEALVTTHPGPWLAALCESRGRPTARGHHSV